MPTARKKATTRKAGTRAKATGTRTKKAGTTALSGVVRGLAKSFKAPKPPKAPKRITGKTTDSQCVAIVKRFATNVGSFMEKRQAYKAKLEAKTTKKTALQITSGKKTTTKKPKSQK